MRWVLLAIAVLGALAIGCVDHRARPAPTPGGAAITLSTPADRGIPVATPTATGRPLTAAERCEARGQSPWKLTLAPRAPRGGESVRVTGSGLAPGPYFALLGIPQSDLLTYSARPVAVVAADGILDIQLTLHDSDGSTCRQLFLYQAPTGDRLRERVNSVSAAPFIMSGNVLTPAACERLPENIWLGWGGQVATISPPPYQPNRPITVTGTGLIDALSGAREIQALFRIAHDPTPDGAVKTLLGAGTRDAAGNFNYTFIPRPDPALEGLCIDVTVYGRAVGGLGAPFAVARFTYP